jgi:NADH-quinone oxidoreductase subunit J
MQAEMILFLILALVAVASAVAMLLARNPVYSAVFLILNFSTIALFYLMLNAPFIAMAQITVYAGAIMVLFLFVIMLLGGEQVHQKEDLPWQRILAVTLGLILLGEFVYTLTVGQAGLPGMLVSSETPAAVGGMAFGSPLAIGDSLFKQYVLPFEVTAILLLVAMIGAIVITQKKKG